MDAIFVINLTKKYCFFILVDNMIVRVSRV